MNLLKKSIPQRIFASVVRQSAVTVAHTGMNAYSTRRACSSVE
jgi:hypothetical protein